MCSDISSLELWDKIFKNVKHLNQFGKGTGNKSEGYKHNLDRHYVLWPSSKLEYSSKKNKLSFLGRLGFLRQHP